MKRGDIHTVAGGSGYAGKPRPVIIYQNMDIATESVILIPVTSSYVEAPDLRIYLPPGGETGLRQPSWAMSEKITAAPRSKVGQRLGSLPPSILREIDQAVLVATGIAGP
ncbi:MAG: type II toxin-antitoxin system PemK/MazF family toxin [Bifidobacteriaceae bacterium]|jgi:mRNA interferase MazF|nr:type II toxin-antitoxin system PemK/MazF family toxin [Bifidobacteriaceae bacterium]